MFQEHPCEALAKGWNVDPQPMTSGQRVSDERIDWLMQEVLEADVDEMLRMLLEVCAATNFLFSPF